MRETTLITRSFILLVALAASVGCAPRPTRYQYLSFEETPDVEVKAHGLVEVDHLLSRSTIPVEYLVAREHYRLRIRIDARKYFANAMIELENSPGFRLVPRPSRGTRADRPRSCGSYDNVALSGDRFEFSWVICGEAADAAERVVAFDVIAEDLGVTEENLRFNLKKDGVYLLRDSL